MIEIMNPAEKAKLLPATGTADSAPTGSSSSTAPPAYVASQDVERQQTSQYSPLPERPKSQATGRFIKALVLSFVIWLAVWATFHALFKVNKPNHDDYPPVRDVPAPPYDPSLPHSEEPTQPHGILSWTHPVLRHEPNQSNQYYASNSAGFNLDPADLQLIRVLGPQSAGSIVYWGVKSTANYATVHVEARWEEYLGPDWGVEELSRVDGGMFLSEEKSKITEFSLLTKEPHSTSKHSSSPSGQLQFHINVIIPIHLQLNSTLFAFEGSVFSTVYDSLKSIQVGGLSVKINTGSITADGIASKLTNFTINTGSIYGKYRPSSDFIVNINSGSVHASLLVPHPPSSSFGSPSAPSSSSAVQPLKLPIHEIHTNTGSIELEYTSIPYQFNPHINLTANAGHVNLRLPYSFKGPFDAGSTMGSVEVVDEKQAGRVKEDRTEKTWTGRRTWGWIGKGQRDEKREGEKEKDGNGYGSVFASVHVGGINLVIV
ncbi:hypothetical protein [Phaffia rhodozyma]|uniref:DUF7330 domain-containing protein n=1 Tax=Phaffia rhodozyma TaxID=264483 RepID=A0A0F7SHC5_PHARH|nr:hypothetical protein [Phaffia rhodozyma]